FMDAFLLFCAIEPSDIFANNGFCTDSHNNFGTVVKEGRKPGLTLIKDQQSISLADWGTELIERIVPYAQLLDQALDSGNRHVQAVSGQQAKLTDSKLTPSAILLASMRDQGVGLHEYTLQQSLRHREALRASPLSDDQQHEYA